MKRTNRLILVAIAIVTLSSCAIHGSYGHRNHHRNDHRHHHDSFRMTGHVHGSPGKVLGVLAVGAIIGSIIENAAHDNDRTPTTPPLQCQDGCYVETKNGECFWVIQEEGEYETRTLVANSYCEE